MDQKLQQTIDSIKTLSIGECKEITATSAKMVIDAVAYLNEKHGRGHEIFQGITRSTVTRVK